MWNAHPLQSGLKKENQPFPELLPHVENNRFYINLNQKRNTCYTQL